MLQTVKVQSLWFFSSNLLPLTFSKILAFYLIFVFRAALEGRLLRFHFPHFTVETNKCWHTNKCSWGEEQAAELLLAAPPVAVLLATFHPPRVHTLLPSSLVPSPVSLHHLLSQGSFLNRLCWPLAVISPSFPRERSLYFLWVPPPLSADALKSRYHVENSRIVTSLCSSQTCEFLEDTGYVWFHVLVLYLSRFLLHGL